VKTTIEIEKGLLVEVDYVLNRAEPNVGIMNRYIEIEDIYLVSGDLYDLLDWVSTSKDWTKEIEELVLNKIDS